MASTVQHISQLAQDTTAEITANPWNWMNFLDTSSRLYRYTFSDQLLIHAQRPDATACASFELWKNTMRRYVRRGSKGIALMDTRNGYPRLRYVFDVSDTGQIPNKSRSPELWTLEEQHMPSVTYLLEQEYKVAEAPLYEQLIAVADSLAEEYWQDHEQEILQTLESSLYDELDALTIEVEFKATLTASVAYTLCNRCGLPVDQIMDAEDFPHLYNFNSLPAVTCLGTAVSELSEPVLMEIGRTVKRINRIEHERSNEHEQPHLPAERGLSASRTDDRTDTKGTAGQVRTDPAEPSAAAPDDSVQRPSVIRFLTDYTKGSRREDTETDRPDNSRTDTDQSAARQSQRSDEVDSAHEQPAPPSGGTDTDRPYLEQVNLFPSQDETIKEIAEAPASAVSISDEDIDGVLLSGSHGIKFPLMDYMNEHGRERGAAAYLKEQYGVRAIVHLGTSGFFNERGLMLQKDKGDGTKLETALSWPKVQARILKLISQEKFLMPLEQAEYREWQKNQQTPEPEPITEPPAISQPEQAVSEQPQPISLTAQLKDTPFTLEQVDTIIRTGGNQRNSILRIVAHYSKDKSLEEQTKFLMNEYRTGGKGFAFGDQKVSVWFDAAGMMLGNGDTALQGEDSVLLSWEQAAERTGELLESGEYLSRDQLDEAPEHEYTELAEKLWLCYRDHMGEYAEFPESWRSEQGGFPADVQQIKELLMDKEECGYIAKRVAKDFAALPADIKAKRGFQQYLDLPGRLQDIQQPAKTFPAQETLPDLGYTPFITEDEVDVFFTRRGNSFKYRMVSFYQQGHSQNELADFVKNEYCNSGSSHALSGADHSHFDGFSNKIKLSRDYGSKGDCKVELSWVKAVKWIEKLITEGRYLNKQELDHIPDYEKQTIASDVTLFYSTLPSDVIRPYPRHDGWNKDRAELAEVQVMLDNPAKVEVLLADIQANIAARDAERDYEHTIRERVVERLTAYQAGTFTLFPGFIEPEPAEAEPTQLNILDMLKPEQAAPEAKAPEPATPDFDTVEELTVQEEPVQAESTQEIPIGTEFEIEGRRFRVDSVNYDWNTVSLQDVTFQSSVGFPIFRSETIDFVLQYWQPLETNTRQTEPQSELPEPGTAKPAPLPTTQSTGQEPVNYRITNADLGAGGAKTKYKANVAAIRTLKTIEADNRLATPKEQEILSGFVGWGGLPGAFAADNTDWAKEYAELKELLTPEEYRAAKASTLNAFYTSPVVIQSIYQAIEGMGFKGGNILEPACGVGNFFGLLPESMADSHLYGVELDSITGRIAQQLYQKANIAISGFEKTDLPNAFFDIAIGNVPFGGYKVADKEYDRLNYNIHDYFFAKTFDKVRPGGVVAFITTSGTMDKKNPEVRKYLAQRGELVGAVRLPNNAFKSNAGTEVTSDILFFQKRDRQIDIEPDWVHLGLTEDGIPVNSYFADNPQMILGQMAYDPSMYGKEDDTACFPTPGADLSKQLSGAMQHIQAEIEDTGLDDIPDIEKQQESIPADPDVKNFSFTIVDNEIYFRENSRMYRRELPKATSERVRHMVELRDTVQRIIEYQLNDTPDTILKQEQAHLNRIYDSFTAKYGLINSRGNNMAFSDDSAYYLLCSLEILDEDGRLDRKADLFTKRTIGHKEPVSHVDTAAEALAVSIGEKACVDLGFMHTLSGLSHEQLVNDLEGVIYRVPAPDSDTTELFDAQWQTADEYLSGNVREKLAYAEFYEQQYPGLFTGNVEALTAAQPKDLEAQEISVRLGVEWIGTDYVQQFMEELFEPGEHEKDIQVKQFGYTGEWTVTGSRANHSENVLATVTYGTSRANGYRLLEDALNQRDTRIYDLIKDADGEHRVLNKKETMLAQQKQEAIKEAFKNWIFDDSDRRQSLVDKYNTEFNSIRPREYDGSHIQFSGMNPDISLRKHQRDAIAHGLYGGNTMLAHEVGAGKTFEMIALAMESKRLGLTSKNMFAVPNHLTEQTAAEFLRLYPSANILVARKKDFETKNRKKFCARIATGNYDAVIVGHSQFERIPVSRERQERLLREQIDEIMAGIEELKEASGERIWVKRLEQTKKGLETRLERLTDPDRKDDVVTFEELGVDRLFVDEAHAYKNLFLHTKMRNVAGLSTSDAQKSSDLFLKCRYLDELTGSKGIVFATGTPVSNSMTELYTMMRYLQYGDLMKLGFQHFDSWAAQYGETTTSLELAPEGNGYRARTRFARFYNLPELMNLFKEAADIKTADVLNLPTPKAHYHTEVIPPSEIQENMVTELSQRASRIHDGMVDPRDDNMLKITSDGRKIGLDQRLMDDTLPDDPASKVNVCMSNVYQIWQDTKARRSTQLIFCDMATPNKDGRFSVYDDIKAKLIARGVPEQEIAFIHDAKTEVQKQALFAKVRRGQVRVLLGSTPMMGTGANVQDRLIALHDLDCPWRPSDLSQRAGRIIRQGNGNKEVHIYRYVTEKTFDAYLWQTVETKQRFIAQIMTSKTPLRTCEDLDATALSFAEIKALCAGDPLIKEKTDLEMDIRKLRVLQSEYKSQHYKLEDNLLTHYPRRIKATESWIAGLEQDQQQIKDQTHPNDKGFSPMVVGKKEYTDKEQAGKALLLACKTIHMDKGQRDTEPVNVGSYRGMGMELSAHRDFASNEVKYKLSLTGAMRYGIELGGDVFGNITRINNELGSIPARITDNKAELEDIQKQIANARTELARPFVHQAELEQKVARLAEVDTLLDLDKNEPELIGDDEPDRADLPEHSQAERQEVTTPSSGEPVNVAGVAKNTRPSILEQLKSPPSDHVPHGKEKMADITI